MPTEVIVDYPIKTLSQLRLILQGFRKANHLTQAALAEKLGITQQSYAQLEANPASASMERLFKVLRALDVEIVLSGSTPSASNNPYAADAPPSSRGAAWLVRDSAGTAVEEPVHTVSRAKKKENW